MSAWQFEVLLHPVDGLQAEHGLVPDSVETIRVSVAATDEEIDRACDTIPNYWIKSAFCESVVSSISEMMPKEDSWSEDALFFGDRDKDRLEVWFHDGKLERVKALISLSDPRIQTIRKLLDVVSSNQCVFSVVASGKIFKPTGREFIRNALGSSSARYLPESFDSQLFVEQLES